MTSASAGRSSRSSRASRWWTSAAAPGDRSGGERRDARRGIARVAAQEAQGAGRRHAGAAVLVAPVRLAHRLARGVERVVADEPRGARGAREHERCEAARGAARLDRGAVGEQLAAGVLAVPLGQVRRHGAGRSAGRERGLGARERLVEPRGDDRGVVRLRLLAREQRVEGRDVAPRGVAPEPDRLDERRPGAAERIEHEPARRAVALDQRLGELWAGTCRGTGAGRARASCARSAAGPPPTTRARGRSRRTALPASRSRAHASRACGRRRPGLSRDACEERSPRLRA